VGNAASVRSQGMLKDHKILRKLAGIREVPTLPEVMHNVMRVLGSEDSSVGDLKEILVVDQALCSKVLKVANSAFFSQRRRIYDIGDAIVLLGFDHIAQLALATTVFSAFGKGPLSDRFDINAFWEHSIAMAFAGKMISDISPDPSRRKILYTAGLLHDIGKVLLLTQFPDEYAVVLARAEAEAELLVLGFTHCEAGEWVCDRWNFPETLIGAIAGHHSDALSGAFVNEAGVIIRLADIICNRLRIGASGNKKTYPLKLEEYQAIGIEAADVERIELDLEKRRDTIKSLLKAIV